VKCFGASLRARLNIIILRGTMCELTVYILKGNSREKAMEGVVKIMAKNDKVLLEGIFGDSTEIEGRLADVDIMNQSANIIAN